jgi:hypothetical protein
VDFGGGPISASSGNELFLAKYDAAGQHLWSKGVPGASPAAQYMGNGVAVGPSGQIVVTGHFVGTVDFGGGPLTSAGQDDIFVAAYDAAGQHLWSKRFGGTNGDDGGAAVAVDAAGNVLVTGAFRGTVDFGGGPFTAVSALDTDLFILKLSPTGQHLWSHAYGNTLDDTGLGIATDAAGNVFVTGRFGYTISLGGPVLSCTGNNIDSFIAKYSPAGQHLWSKCIWGALDDSGVGIAAGAAGDVVVTGTFSGPTTFGGPMFTANGLLDVFVAHYDAAGQHIWSTAFGGTGYDWGYGVALDAAGYAYVTGFFQTTVDFGAGPVMSVGQEDAYLVKLAP